MRSVALATCLFLAAGLPALASPYDQVVVFGDSNVDNGNSAAAAASMGVVINPPPNFGGRNNNGPVVVEYLANNLGVPLDDRAFSGATTGTGISQGFVTNTLTQVTNYVISKAGAVDPNALYVYWAGSNDLLGVGSNPALLASSINTAIANIGAAVSDLTSAGAGTIVVANRTPRTSLTSQDNLNGIALNAAIAAAIPSFDADGNVVAFDDYSLIANLITNGASEGFTHTAPTDVCINIPSCANNLSVASSYVFWDSVHKTTAVHAILANAIEAEVAVPEPSTAWLMLGAGGMLVGAAFLRRQVGGIASPSGT